MIKKILGGLVAFFALLAMGLKLKLLGEKLERAETDLKDEKATSELSDRVTNASMEGLENEARPIIRNGKSVN